MSQPIPGIQPQRLIERLLDLNDGLQWCAEHVLNSEGDINLDVVGNIEQHVAAMERHLLLLQAAEAQRQRLERRDTQTQPAANAAANINAARERKAIRVEFTTFMGTMVIRYEALSVPFEGVVIRLRLPHRIEPQNITPISGHYELGFDPDDDDDDPMLEWRIAPINHSHYRGEIMIVVPFLLPRFFPTSIRFPSTRTYSDLKVKMPKVPVGFQTVLMADQYDEVQRGEMNE